MVTCNMDYYKLDMIINPIKSRKTIFLIRVTTSAERYCNEELFSWSKPSVPMTPNQQAIVSRSHPANMAQTISKL